MTQRYIKIYFDWPDATAELTEIEQMRLLNALIAYARGEFNSAQLVGNERFLFPTFKAQIDRDTAAYEAISAKRKEAGANGGKQKAINLANASKSSNCKQDLANLANASKSSNCKQDLANLAKPSKSSQDKDKDKDKEYIPPISPTGGGNINTLFSEFWSAYPRKVSKQAAVKAWDKLKPDEALSTLIIQAVERFKRCSEWQQDGGQYIPYPATFLNGRRWEDEVSEPAPEAPQADTWAEYCDPIDLQHLYD